MLLPSFQSKRPVIRHVDNTENLLFGLEMPVFLALVGSLSVLIVGAVIFAVMLKRDINAKRKMQGLSSAADIDAEATRDYQVNTTLNYLTQFELYEVVVFNYCYTCFI